MATSIGEIEATLRLKDELTAQLGKAQAAVSDFAGKAEGASKSLLGFEIPNMGSLVTGLAGAAAAMLSFEIAGRAIDAVADAFTSVVDRASQLSDLSAKTDISTRALQRFEFAGALVGVSLDQIAGAATQLQKHLGGDSNGVVAAVGRLGLNLESLRAMDSATQLETVAGALSRVGNQSERAFLAGEVGGRGFLSILPLLKSDLSALGDEAERIGAVMGDDLVASGDEVGDAWTRLQFIGKGLLSEVFGQMIKDLAKWISIIEHPLDTVETNLALISPKHLLPEWRELVGLVNAVFGSNAPPALPASPLTANRAASRLDSFRGADGRTLDASMINGKAAQKEFDDAQKAREKSATAAAKNIQRAAEEAQKALDKLTGEDVLKKAAETMASVGKIGGFDALGPAGIVQVHKDLGAALDVLAERGQTASLAMVDLWLKSTPTPAVIKGIEGLQKVLKDLGKPIPPVLNIPGVTPGLGDLGNVGATGVLPDPKVGIDSIRMAWVNLGLEQQRTAGQAMRDYQSMKDAGTFTAEQLFRKWAEAYDGMMARQKGWKTEFLDTMTVVIGSIGRVLSAFENTSDLGKFFESVAGGMSRAGAAANELKFGIASLREGFSLQGIQSIAVGVAGVVEGFQQATSEGGKLKKTLGGAMVGLKAGAVFGPWGAAIGAGVGAIAGLAKGLLSKDGRKAVEEFAASFGGFDKLQEKLAGLGAEGETLWKNLTQGVGSNNPEQAKKAIDAITAALEQQSHMMEHINTIVSGVNDRSKNVTSQGDLNVVAAGATAAFGLMVQQGMSAVAAFNALSPAITAMNTAMATGNFTLSDAGMRLMGLNAIIQQNSVEFQNLAASGSIIQAMLQGNIRDGALFAAVATDIGTQIQTIIDRGVPMEQALALSQPQLQALWEAQQKFGFATDETTQAILDQAVAQGFVGEQMKTVNQQILDVLLAIADVFGAKIPDAMAGLPAAADAAAAGMNNAFGKVRGPSFQPTEDQVVDPLADVPGLAGGGIVRARTGGTLVRVGEGGSDEAVVPLDGSNGTGGGVAIIEIDGVRIAEILVPHIPGVVTRYGLA